jgi:hypothetical protein
MRRARAAREMLARDENNEAARVAVFSLDELVRHIVTRLFAGAAPHRSVGGALVVEYDWMAERDNRGCTALARLICCSRALRALLAPPYSALLRYIGHHRSQSPYCCAGIEPWRRSCRRCEFRYAQESPVHIPPQSIVLLSAAARRSTEEIARAEADAEGRASVECGHCGWLHSACAYWYSCAQCEVALCARFCMAQFRVERVDAVLCPRCCAWRDEATK